MREVQAPAGPMLRVEASRRVGASAKAVYRTIADYRDGHPRILPPQYFRNLQVQSGGYGDGTVIRFDIIAFGKTHVAVGHVTEPEPGRVLIESYPATKSATTFIVEPAGAAASHVTFVTEIPTRSGLLGIIERALMSRYLKKVYAVELAQLDAVVTGHANGAQP